MVVGGEGDEEIMIHFSNTNELELATKEENLMTFQELPH